MSDDSSSNVNRCCGCADVGNRCGTDSCPCSSGDRPCLDNCETERFRSNCLNQTLTRCSCVRMVNSPKSKPEVLFCNSERCECHRYHEACGPNCGCGGMCLNRNSPRIWTAPRPDPPSCIGCKCSGKKACLKAEKCSCLQYLSYCTFLCKCNASCNNASSNAIPGRTRLIFNHPDEGESAVICKLTNKNGYAYRLVFASDEKSDSHPIEQLCEAIHGALSRYHIPISHIAVYSSNSPCFHQSCYPRCEVLDNCISQRACAKRLRCLLKQIQRQTGSVDITMTVKFFCPYVHRGDLYTRQAILCLMEGGITVEPLTMKDWGEVMHENDTVPQQTSSQISLWAAANMDRHVKASQHYINSCRRLIGGQEGLWTSPFHEMIRSTILTLGITQHRLDKLNEQLVQLGRVNYYTSQADIYGSCIAVERLPGRYRLTRQETSDSLRPRSLTSKRRSNSFHFPEREKLTLVRQRVCMSPDPAPVSSVQSSTAPTPIPLISESRNKSSSSLIGCFGSRDKVLSQNGPITDGLTNSVNHERATENESVQKNCQSHSSDAASSASDKVRTLEHMLLNYSSKSLTFADCEEMHDEISETVDKIQNHIVALVTYLEQKSGPDNSGEVKV